MPLLRLAATFLRLNLLNEVQYRVNFFLQVLESLVALGIGLVGLALVFDHTTALAGWSRPELLAVMGVHILMGGFIRALIQPNMLRLMTDIQAGTLDFALTKPADAQVLVSVREVRLWQIVDVAVGAIVLASAIAQLPAVVGWWPALAFAVALLLGGIMIYSFWVLLTSSAFWVVRVQEMANLFEGIYAAGRWPIGLYPGWLRGGLTFLVPIAFAVTVPAEALTGRLKPLTLAGAALLALGLFLLARFVFRRGLRQYAGASA